MSVMQVVGSSRISNTAYLAVSSIYWSLFLTLSGATLNLDIQTALLLITPSAGFAAILWVMNLEEFIVVQLLSRGLPKSGNSKFIRYHMGYSILHIQPWKETLFEWPTIQSSLRQETKRILRSPLLKEEMETLYQLFWLLLSVPALFSLLGIAQYGFDSILIWVVLAIVVDVILILVTFFRKHTWVNRTLGLAYYNWCTELIGTTDRRRKSFSSGSNNRFPLGTPHFFPKRESIATNFIEKTEPWINELIAIVNREDWEGFEKNSDSFLNSQSIVYSRLREDDIICSLVIDLIWSLKRKKIMEPYDNDVTASFGQFHAVVYLQRVRTVIADALIEIRKTERHTSDNSLNTRLSDFLNKWKLPVKWEDIYGIIDNQILRSLSQIIIQSLSELPYFIDNPSFDIDEVCKSRVQKRLWPLDCVICLQKAVDRKLIAPNIVFAFANNIGVKPTDYITQCSPHVRSLFLEIESDIPATELKRIIREVIEKSPNLDTNKAAAILNLYRNDSEFAEIIKIIEDIHQSRVGKSTAKRTKELLVKLEIDDD